MPTEFDEWVERFVTRRVPDGWRDGAMQFKDEPLEPPQCMYAVREGPHKRACLKDAKIRSKAGLPTCGRHARGDVRESWRGYIEGA